MSKVIFWDEDTQVDFMYPGRPLYVPGGETILPALDELTEFARRAGIRILGSEDWHSRADAEISDDPNWMTTFPPHCMAGTEGQLRVPETRPLDPLYVSSSPRDPDELVAEVRRHGGEVFFRKQTVDLFSNPNVEPVLAALAPETVVVYGVATDFCVFHAVEGFLRRRAARVIVAADAIRAIDEGRGSALLRGWAARGVEIADTAGILSRLGAATERGVA